MAAPIHVSSLLRASACQVSAQPVLPVDQRVLLHRPSLGDIRLMRTTTSPTLHPFNRPDFSWTDHRGPFRRVSEAQGADFDRDGFLLLRGLLDPAVVAAVRERADEIDGETSAGQSGGDIRFTAGLAARDAQLRSLATSAELIDVAIDLIGPDVRLYWDQLAYKRPGAVRPFPWHQDNAYGFTEPQHYLSLWIPLVDATVQNGCPWVAPGEHRQGTLFHWWVEELGWVCRESDDGGVPVEAQVGDVVVFSSLLPHRTGPNSSEGTRKAYLLQYMTDGTILRDANNGARRVQADPNTQFVVAAAGKPVSVEPLATVA